VTEQNVGKRIKKIREFNELSLDTLAERTGYQMDFLQSLEEDEVYPSLGPLLKVSRALGTRLGTLLDDKTSRDPLVCRQEDRKSELSMIRGKNKPVSLEFYSLGKDKTDRHMEPFYIRILPEAAKDKQLSSHEGEEFIVVVSGEVEVTYGQETYILKPGDSIYYNSIVPHNVSCTGDEEAEIYAVLYFPE